MGRADLHLHALGWVYAALVLDVFSRIVTGWQLSTTLRTDHMRVSTLLGEWRPAVRHPNAHLSSRVLKKVDRDR